MLEKLFLISKTDKTGLLFLVLFSQQFLFSSASSAATAQFHLREHTVYRNYC